MNLFSKARTVGYYAEGLYDLGGQLIKKRRQKYRPLTDKSADIRSGMIKNYVIPLWGSLPIIKLTAKMIDDRLVTLMSVREGKELSGTVKNTILTILDDVFAVAIDDGVILYNPVQNIMRFSRELTHQRGAIPKDEMSLLFPVSHDELVRVWGKQIYATAYLVLKDTGLRPGELRALKWGDWFSDLMFFPVTKAIESGKRDKIKGTKTRSVKPAVVTKQTASEIEVLKESRVSHNPDDFIFSNKRGPFTIDRLVYNFRQGVLRAGINRPEYSPYWLRHTFNTRMLDVLPDEAVRLLMGHKTEAMTRHYRHPDIESLKREAEKIRKMLNLAGN